MRGSRFRVRQFLATAALLAASAASFIGPAAMPAHADAPADVSADASTAAPVSVPYNQDHPVLAYYYAWWEADVLARGIERPVRYPTVPFGQIIDDVPLVREHIREAQAAGIDGFVVNQTSDMARLLAISQEYDFRVTAEIDATRNPEAQLADFYANAGSPAMVRYQGRPVVFFWRASAVSDAAWRSIRNRLDPDHAAVWLADGDNFNVLGSDVWDGISPYQIAWSPTPETQLPGWGAKAAAAAPGKLYVPPVAPGCNDSVVRATTCIQDRADGTYYQRSLQGALASNPSWAVIVSTFNEWMEDTQIEPSSAYGDLYLQITRQFAEEFKGAVPAPPCC